MDCVVILCKFIQRRCKKITSFHFQDLPVFLFSLQIELATRCWFKLWKFGVFGLVGRSSTQFFSSSPCTRTVFSVVFQDRNLLRFFNFKNGLYYKCRLHFPVQSDADTLLIMDIMVCIVRDNFIFFLILSSSSNTIRASQRILKTFGLI